MRADVPGERANWNCNIFGMNVAKACTRPASNIAPTVMNINVGLQTTMQRDVVKSPQDRPNSADSVS